MSSVDDLRKALEEFKRQPKSVGVKLRLDLARVLLRHLNRRNWSQRQLAKLAGMKESFVSRILHSDSNLTFETAGKLLHALGIDASIIETTPSWASDISFVEIAVSASDGIMIEQDNSYDEEIGQEVATTGKDRLGVTEAWASETGPFQYTHGAKSQRALRLG